MADVKEGDEFRVSEIVEWKENGITLSRYRPEHVYRVTERNMIFVEDLLDGGKAVIEKVAPPKQAARAKSSGKVTSKKKKGA